MCPPNVTWLAYVDDSFHKSILIGSNFCNAWRWFMAGGTVICSIIMPRLVATVIREDVLSKWHRSKSILLKNPSTFNPLCPYVTAAKQH